MRLDEKKIQENPIYNGRIISLYDDEVELPNGRHAHREVVRHPGGATVCAIDPELNVYFVRQYRYPYAKELLEIPAGKLEAGENPYDAAMRELHEEVGLVAEELYPLGEMYPTPGYTDEVIYIYLAIHFKQASQHLDPGEFINVVKMPLQEALDKVMKGELRDGKSQIAILKASLMLKQLSEAAQSVLGEENMPDASK